MTFKDLFYELRFVRNNYKNNSAYLQKPLLSFKILQKLYFCLKITTFYGGLYLSIFLNKFNFSPGNKSGTIFCCRN